MQCVLDISAHTNKICIHFRIKEVTMPTKQEKQRVHLAKLAANARNLEQQKRASPSEVVPPVVPVPVTVDPHLSSFPNCSKEEILSEYMYFLRNLPPLIASEKVKLTNNVKNYLKVDSIILDFHKLDLNNLLHIKEGSHILDYMSVESGKSCKILCPPIQKCLLCGSGLTMSNKPTQVSVLTLHGPELYSKYIYRCRGCRLSPDQPKKKNETRQDVYYHHDRVSISYVLF